MQLARLAAKVLLTFIVLCETGVAWRLWRHGPPMELVTTGEQLFKWVRSPPSASDWTIPHYGDCAASCPRMVPLVVQA